MISLCIQSFNYNYTNRVFYQILMIKTSEKLSTIIYTFIKHIDLVQTLIKLRGHIIWPGYLV